MNRIRSYLILHGSGHEGRTIPITAQLTIGRSPSNKIQLAGSSISRQHASLHPIRSQVIIEDAGSYNGTFVNGERIRKRILASGDLIQLGNLRATFLQEEVEDARECGEGSDTNRHAMATDTDTIRPSSYQPEVPMPTDHEPAAVTECLLANRDNLSNRIQTSLRKARYAVYFAIPTLTDQRIKEALIDCRNRGQTVRGLISHEQLDHDPEQMVHLRETGVEIRMTGPEHPLMRHCFMIIDEETTLLGNIDVAAQTHPSIDQSILILNGKHLAEILCGEFLRIWEILDASPRPWSRSEPFLSDLGSELIRQSGPGELDENPAGPVKNALNQLMIQGKRSKAVDLFNRWSTGCDGLNASYDLMESSQEEAGIGRRPLAEESPTALEDNVSDYWHTDFGQGLTRRDIFMMKQQFGLVVKRLILICLISLVLGLTMIFTLPQPVFLSYVGFLGFLISFGCLYVTLILFNYRLAKALGKKALLWGILSILFVPSLFLYSWLMNRT